MSTVTTVTTPRRSWSNVKQHCDTELEKTRKAAQDTRLPHAELRLAIESSLAWDALAKELHEKQSLTTKTLSTAALMMNLRYDELVTAFKHVNPAFEMLIVSQE